MNMNYVVADDSMFARMLLKDAVSQINPDATFIETASGAETLDYFEKSGVHLDWFLLDMNMGEPNGVDTGKALIAQGVEKNRIALVTGNRSTDLQNKASEIGLSYINKAISPSDIDEFVLRLRRFFLARHE